MDKKPYINNIVISVIVILLVWSSISSILLFRERKLNQDYHFQQFAELHNSLIGLNIAFDSLYKITSNIEPDVSLHDNEFLNIAVENACADLTIAYNRINVITGRIENEANNFSFTELLAIIKRTENLTKDIFKSSPIDYNRLDFLNEMLSSTTTYLSDLVYNTPTEDLNSKNFRNELNLLINSMHTLLDKADIGK